MKQSYFTSNFNWWLIFGLTFSHYLDGIDFISSMNFLHMLILQQMHLDITNWCWCVCLLITCSEVFMIHTYGANSLFRYFDGWSFLLLSTRIYLFCPAESSKIPANSHHPCSRAVAASIDLNLFISLLSVSLHCLDSARVWSIFFFSASLIFCLLSIMCCLMLNNEVGGKAVLSLSQDSETGQWTNSLVGFHSKKKKKKSKQTSAYLKLHIASWRVQIFMEKHNDCIIICSMLSYPLKWDNIPLGALKEVNFP